MATTPGYSIVIPPGGKEGSNNAQTWWVCWLVLQNSDFALHEEFWMRGSWSMTSDSAVPNNFCPHVNIHVSGSNPAFNGVAVSPIQYDLASQGHYIYTHGAGTYDSSIDQYRDVVKFTTNPAPAYAKNVIYDWVMHGILDPDPNVGFIEMWVNGHDGSSWTIANLHTPTFYNSDPGPLNLYFGFYTKGLPAENSQPNSDAATFKINAYLPRKAASLAAVRTATPLVFDHARGALGTPVYTVTGISAIDDANFVWPAELGGGGGGATPGSGSFGKTTIGGTWGDADTPYKFANRIGPIPAGYTYTLSNPRIYLRGNPAGTSSQDVKLILWADGSPIGNVLNVGSNKNIVAGGSATAAGWNTFLFEGAASTYDVVNAGSSDLYIWMGVINQGQGNACQIAYDAGASTDNPFKTSGTEYGTIADGQAFGTPDGTDASDFSFAVDYIANPPPPYNTSIPTISGTPTVGNVQTCAHGTWVNAGTPAYTYQWTRDGADIASATASTYTLVNADRNHSITCVVTNTDIYGVGVLAAAPFIPTGIAPTNTLAPTITYDLLEVSGTGAAVSLGTWNDDGAPTLTQQWQRANSFGGSYSNITSATATSYTFVTADQTKYIRLAVTNTTPDGSNTAYSNEIGPIAGAPPPVVEGTLTLTVVTPTTITLTPIT